MNDNKIVLPMRAAFERAVNDGTHSKLRGRVLKSLRRNHGIIFKKQWWNVRRCKQEVTKWWQAWLKQLAKEERNDSRIQRA